MDYADKTLCEQLYDLSGWGREPNGLAAYDRETGDIYEGGVILDGEGYLRPSFVPAYNLGYLLRKLPTHHNLGAPYVSQTNNGENYMASFMNWWALWEYDGKGSATRWHNELVTRGFHKLADTPEDAAAELAVELFKQGLL